MDIYQLRLAERANEAQRADHLAHLKANLGVFNDEQKNSQVRKRRNSVFKLFGKEPVGGGKDKEEGSDDYCETVDDKGVR